ncbi:MAG TPA: MFS transporter, partial [Gammaproteobacteria bacterium]|nr:MFS transporter [Gammaproteobacteria bacterium]
QLAFIAMAAPGIVVFGLVFLLREPRRRARPHARTTAVGLRATFEFVRADWFVYFSLIVGAALSAIGLFGMYAWVPALFTRVYGWPSGQIGLVLGLLTIVLGTAGLFLSGSYAGEFIRRGADIVYQRLMMLSVACAIVPGAISMTAESALAMWACIGAVIFFLGMPFGLAQAAIVAITPNHLRAKLIAVYLVVFNFFGFGLGPAAVAGMSDFVFADAAAVNRSIGIVIVASGVASVLLLALGVKQYEEMGRRANE